MEKRMNALEEQLKILEDKITIEEFNQQKQLSYENVVAYLQKAILFKPKQLIFTLIQKIVVYDDKLDIFFNYTNENNPDDSSRQDYFCNSGSTCYGMVELKAAKTHTVLYQINRTEYYCQVDLPLSDYPLYGKQLVASRG